MASVQIAEGTDLIGKAGLVCSRHLSLLGMGMGLLIDLNSSPTGSILPLCTNGSDPWSLLVRHVILMPTAHLGMVAGAVMTVLITTGTSALCLQDAVIRQVLCMSIAQAAALVLIAPFTGPIGTMGAMAAVMVGFEYLFSVRRKP